MRYLLIGCGRIGTRHADAARSCGLSPVGFCDRVRARAERFAEGDDALVFTDAAEALGTNPELVAIATDSGSHAALARQALLAGANVLIEKPMAMCLSDADSLIELAEQKGLTLAVCHQNRFNPGVRGLFAALGEGALGELCHGAAQVRWYRDAAYYRQAAWRGKWATDGGALMNQSIHCIDLLRAVFGPAKEVRCFLRNAAHPEIETEDCAAAAVRFESGAIGLIEASTCCVPANLSETLSVFGTKGSAVLGGTCLDRVDTWRIPGVLPPDPGAVPPDIYGFGHRALYADIIDAILRGRAPLVSGREGREALALVLACYESAFTAHTAAVR